MSGWRALMSDVNYGISNVGTVMTSCAGGQAGQIGQYHAKLERVKFGVSLDQVCLPCNDLPGPLLMMLLKLNKEGPFKKEVFRAPGHQASMKKLIHFLQQGRLVNIQNYSLNTIASVMKKFLRKIPGGIFGPQNEATIFSIIKMTDTVEQLKAVHRLMTSLPTYSQHLLVLLFGTFRVIAANSVVNETNMTAQALGVSVAPSFFHTCVAAGSKGVARMEDVERFKLATKAVSYFIEHFGMRDLFGRENYEYYARLTGRILKVEDEWIFFTYPLDYLGVRTDIDIECGGPSFRSSHPEMSPTGSLEIIPENCPLDPVGRLSISLDTDNCLLELEPGPGTRDTIGLRSSTLDPRRPARHTHAEAKSFKSSVCLPQVHQKQTERMRARSDWFLSDWAGPGGRGSSSSGLVTYRPARLLSPRPTSLLATPTTSSPVRQQQQTVASVDSLPLTSPAHNSGVISGKPPASAVSNDTPGQGHQVALRRKLSDKDKERRLVRRSSSKRKDKENGGSVDKNGSQAGPALKRQSSGDSSSHCHSSLSRAASQDSSKGRHSRGGSFDQESPSLVSTPEHGVTPRPLPRI